jgi:hypothetical protein
MSLDLEPTPPDELARARFRKSPDPDKAFLEKILSGHFDRSLSHVDHVRIGWLLLNSTFRAQAESIFEAIIDEYHATWLKGQGPHPYDAVLTRKWLGRIAKVMLRDEVVFGHQAARFEIFHERWEEELQSDRRKVKP